MAIYSDVVAHKVRYGDSITNLLALITLDTPNGFTMDRSPILYKPLKSPFFNSISISVHDRNGELIQFESGSVITFELQIKSISSMV